MLVEVVTRLDGASGRQLLRRRMIDRAQQYRAVRIGQIFQRPGIGEGEISRPQAGDDEAGSYCAGGTTDGNGSSSHVPYSSSTVTSAAPTTSSIQSPSSVCWA